MALFRAIILMTVISLTIAPFALVGSETLSAYNVLQEYGLPVGLLPEGVAGYDLNANTGEFKAYLNRDCRFTIESRRFKYCPVVEGIISKGRLENLEGVEVRVMFFWVGIKGVVREGGNSKSLLELLRLNFRLETLISAHAVVETCFTRCRVSHFLHFELPYICLKCQSYEYC